MALAPYILGAAIVATLAADAVLYIRGGFDSTITGWTQKTPARSGCVGVLIGMLIGHLFL